MGQDTEIDIDNLEPLAESATETKLGSEVSKSTEARTQPSAKSRPNLREFYDDIAEAFEAARPAKGTLDRGAGFYQTEREKLKLPSLVETGRHAGRLRVKHIGVSTSRLLYHLWKRDFFITAINTPFWTLMLFISAIYVISFLFFALLWLAIVQGSGNGNCLSPTDGFGDILIFSTVTQTTVGYGNVSIVSCWAGAWLMVIQSLWGMIVDSIVIGLVFARISHPKQRGRSIFISDSACIARRDGILKFMFRIADIRVTQVIEPKITAYLYTWGEGRLTSEGERIPYRAEPLNLGYIDGMLLLPLTIEHTIDERSPLYGHTYDTLMDLQAEIVVTFEGTSEFGNPFMARQSYLPPEIHWGYKFAKIIMPPDTADTRHTVDISRFHEVEPEQGLPMAALPALSKLVVGRAVPTVPYPLLGENTLMVSDKACVTTIDGKLCLMWRVGDTYPNQMVDVHARAYIYRWDGEGRHGKNPKYNMYELELGYTDLGQDRLVLRLPAIVRHVINDDSPLSNWRASSGSLQDADSDLVFVVEGYLYSTSKNMIRMRTYNVFNSVKFDHKFANIVTPPQETRDFKPRIAWSRFHVIEPCEKMLTRDISLRDRSMSRSRSMQQQQQEQEYEDSLPFGAAPPESLHDSVLHSNENTMHSNRSAALNINTVGSGGSYMSDVMGLDAELSRYNRQAGKGVSSGSGTPYDETLAVMTKSPGDYVHYSSLNSLFAAAQALEEEQAAGKQQATTSSTEEVSDNGENTPSPFNAPHSPDLYPLLEETKSTTSAESLPSFGIPMGSSPGSGSRALQHSATGGFVPRHSMIMEGEEEGGDSTLSLPATVRSMQQLSELDTLRRTHSR